VAAVFEDRPFGLRFYLRAIRVHQWLKNLLIGVPLLTSHSWNNLPSVLSLLAAFVSFSLSASATYLLNDLLDLSADRRHPRKSQRPLASGDLSLVTGVGLMIGLLAAGLALAAVVSVEFLLILLLYVGLTVSYSLYFKTIVLIDVIVLASLYTLRILAGTAAIGVVLSNWLFAFSMFLFLSLALVKRCSELKSLGDTGLDIANGRDYRVTDLPVLSVMGIAAGYLAVLVLALFVNSSHDLAPYSHPERLWLLCPPMAYWVSRMWIKTSRGEMHYDPLIFSARDRASWIVVGTMAVISFSAI
jgi:4-hydroxybenzoate polyprenyltransferase